MSHTFHQIYLHFVWATHSRQPLIDRNWRGQFLMLLNEEVKNRGGLPLRHNAMPDHVHLLARLRPTTLISEFIGQIKGATSFRVNHEISPSFKLRWQEGYGVVSLRRDECYKVERYIDNQENHHRNGKLSDTLEAKLLAKADVEAR
ncbi:MAG TPA: IS200/IS605 family transposase [Pyrinomonadaceae bacterium]|nr:IS200/IS605 family transposase [Pyrinomonadaceae bacterium]